MNHKKNIFYIIFILIFTLNNVILCSNSIFSSLIEGLKYGKLENLKEKFNFEKPKCVQGSYFYNGSCYFISNHRPSLNAIASSSNLLFNQFINKNDNSRSLLPTSLQSTIIGTAAISVVLPTQANWLNSSNMCKQLNNESTMIYFDNYDEYEFLINLLLKLKFSNNETDFMKEESFYIGLFFNQSISTWKWLNDLSINESFFIANFTEKKPLLAQLPIMDKKKSDYIYRPCAYLYIRGNGDINIDNDNCDRDQKPYICKYVLDRCYNNSKCGSNGECINLPNKKTFECRCRILYDGKFCEKWSSQGIQMITCGGLVVVAFIITLLTKTLHSLHSKYLMKKKHSNKKYDNLNGTSLLKDRSYSIEYFSVNSCAVCFKYLKKNIKFFIVLLISLSLSCFLLFMVTFARYKLIENKYKKLKSFNLLFKNLNETSTNATVKLDLMDKFTKFISDSKTSTDLCKLVESRYEDYFFAFISIPLTFFIYIYNSFWCNQNHTFLCKIGKIKIKRQKDTSSVKLRSEDNVYENDQFTNTSALSTNAYNSITSDISKHDEIAKIEENEDKNSSTVWKKIKKFIMKIKRNRKDESKRIALCCCTCRFDLISPINPFGKKNRFITAIIYAAYTYSILKMFEYLLLGDSWYDQTVSTTEKIENIKEKITNISPTEIGKIVSNFTSFVENGILTDLLKQIFDVIIIGFKYYPILLCVEMKNKRTMCYILCSFYMWSLFMIHLYTNTFCLFIDSQDYTDIKNVNKTQNLTSFLTKFYEETLPKKNLTNIFGPRRLSIKKNEIDNSSNLSNSSEIIAYTTKSILMQMKRNVITTGSLNKAVDQIKNHINQTKIKNQNFSNLTSNSTYKDVLDDEFNKQKNQLFLSNILYEKLIFYIVLCIITIHFTVETISLLGKKVKNLFIFFKKKSKKEDKSVRISSIFFNDGSNKDDADKQKKYMSAEMLYTKKLFQQKNKTKSFFKHLIEKKIYRFRMHFKYSKQLINTYVVAFILLYYLTCIIIRKSKLIINIINELLILLINLLFKFTNDHNLTGNIIDNEAIQIAASTTRTHLSYVINYLFSNIESNIVISCSLTTAVYVIQMLLGIRSYQKHVLNAYKGVYMDIPPPKRFSNTKKASSSLHYSGYMIGYLLWGYIILFQAVTIITLIIKFLFKFYFIIEKLAKLILPILVIFFFKRIFIWYITRYFLIRHKNKNKKFFLLKNSKLYSILTHFNFFFDSFLGSFVCVMRMIQSSLAALFFMPRLDYSVFGRMLEHSDMGFISYVNFIHLEVSQSHPIKIAFCELLIQSIKEKYDNNDENYNSKNMRARNRWFLLYYLYKIQGLHKQRKIYIKNQKCVPKNESFEQFLERKVHLRTIGKSKSSVSIDTYSNTPFDSITSNTTTLNSNINKKNKNIKKTQIQKIQRQENVSQNSLNV